MKLRIGLSYIKDTILYIRNSALARFNQSEPYFAPIESLHLFIIVIESFVSPKVSCFSINQTMARLIHNEYYSIITTRLIFYIQSPQRSNYQSKVSASLQSLGSVPDRHSIPSNLTLQAMSPTVLLIPTKHSFGCRYRLQHCTADCNHPTTNL